uniref:Inhibitor of growth protein N-terminal histone-binding domain-containing protein n=2 Tax=Ascarididae TaxID=6250 RepID=A0A914RW07_PAREQ
MQRLSDQKIRLSSDAYELVDKHIRKLDDDAAKL